MSNSYLVFNLLLFSIMIMSLVFTIIIWNSKAAKKSEEKKQICGILIILSEMPVFYIFIKFANLVNSKIAFPLVLFVFILSFGGKGLYRLYKLYKIDKDLTFLFGLLIAYFLIVFSIIFIDYKKMFDLFLINM